MRALTETEQWRQHLEADACERQRQEIEEEVKLRLALQRDEANLFQKETADIAEAILRSQIAADVSCLPYN